MGASGKITLACLMFLYLSNPLVATVGIVPELTLSQAIDMALMHNRILRNKRDGLKQSALSIDSAQSEFDFNIKPEITASQDNLGQSVNQLGVVSDKKFRAGAELSLRAGNRVSTDGNATVVSLELSQPLFRNQGFLVNTLPVFTAEQGHTSAQREYQIARQQLVMQVIRSYLEIVRLHRQEQADRDSVERATFSLRTTKAKEQLGVATSIDRLRVEIQLGPGTTETANDHSAKGKRRSTAIRFTGAGPHLAPATSQYGNSRSEYRYR